MFLKRSTQDFAHGQHTHMADAPPDTGMAAEEKMDKAQRVLARSWRRWHKRGHTTRSLAHRFLQKMHTLEYVGGLSYEGLVAHLKDLELCDATDPLLKRIIFLVNRDGYVWLLSVHVLLASLHFYPSNCARFQLHRGEQLKISGEVHPRIVFASLLILFHPGKVFAAAEEDALIKTLKTRTPSFVEVFRQALEALAGGVAWHNLPVYKKVKDEMMKEEGEEQEEGQQQEEATATTTTTICLNKALDKALPGYLKSFKAWKTEDEARIVSELLVGLNNLHRAWWMNRHGSPKICKQLSDQMDRMLDRLQKLSGEDASKKVKAEMDARTELWNAQGAMGSDAPLVIGQHLAQAGAQKRGMNNEQLAHELFLDPEFRLDHRPSDDDAKIVYTRLKDPTPPDFWGNLSVRMQASGNPMENGLYDAFSKTLLEVQGLCNGHPEGVEATQILRAEEDKYMQDLTDFERSYIFLPLSFTLHKKSLMRVPSLRS